jgi:chromosome segregation ATPase
LNKYIIFIIFIQREIRNLKSQLAERDEQIEELNKKYSEISSNIEILIQERDNLRNKCNELTRSSSRINQTINNETQTDDQQQDKFIQINNKLKRALQTIKEKINRIVTEKPELFPQSTDDTIERLDQLISVVENQAKHIKISQNGHDYAEQEIDEHQAKIEQVISQVPSFEDYQKQINQLQQNLSQKEEERTLLRDHFSEVELELRKTIDDQTSTTDRLEALVEERNVLVEQQSLQLIEL